jgi:hypothetical protein
VIADGERWRREDCEGKEVSGEERGGRMWEGVSEMYLVSIRPPVAEIVNFLRCSRRRLHRSSLVSTQFR